MKYIPFHLPEAVQVIIESTPYPPSQRAKSSEWEKQKRLSVIVNVIQY